MTLPIFTKLTQILGFKKAEEYCSLCNVPLILERDTRLTSVHACPSCGYFKIKLKLFPPGKIPEIKPEEIKLVEKPEVLPKVEALPPVEVEKLEVKPAKPVAIEEKIPEKPKKEIKPKVPEKPAPPKEVKVKEEKPKIEKAIEEAAEIYKVPAPRIKKIYSAIEEIEKKIPEKPKDMLELKKRVEEIERKIREEKINIVPEVVEKLIEAKAKISEVEEEKVPERLAESRIRRKIKEIESKIEQIKEAKEVVKDRYYKGEIDESSLKTMMENYEQKLIEAEIELKHWKKELKKLEKGEEVTLPEAPEVTPVPVTPFPVGPVVIRMPPEREVVKPKRIFEEEVIRPPAKKLPLLPALPEAREERVVREIKVSDVMSRNVITVKPTDSLRVVAEILSENRIGGAPVVSEGNFVGIITEEDIFRAVGARDEENLKKLEEVNVASVMEKSPVTIREDINLSEASNLMREHNIDRLPVLDKENRLIGIVTRSDVIRGISKQLVGELIPTEEIKVETGIDEIIKIVNEAGSVSIGEIAKRLNIKEERIEEWAKVLEEHNLLKLFYPAIGKPILRKIE